MKSFLAHLKQHFMPYVFLTESEWIEIRGIIIKTTLKKGKQLFAKNGELLFLTTGLLIENQKLGSNDMVMVRFFQKDEVFLIPKEVGESEIIAVQDCILLSIKSDDLEKAIKNSVGVLRFLQMIKDKQADKDFKRQLLLQGLKSSRFDNFCKSFPGCAASFALTTLAGYLDVNPSYLSTTKNLRKKKPD